MDKFKDDDVYTEAYNLMLVVSSLFPNSVKYYDRVLLANKRGLLTESEFQFLVEFCKYTGLYEKY